MYHFNGTAWVRLAPPSSSTSTNVKAANFHGINSGPVAHCSLRNPVTVTCHVYGGENEQQRPSRTSRRLPLKQLFPRTPTPFKKAYAAAVQKGGCVEQLDLQKSPELFEDLKEIILKDVILPPPKRIRKMLLDNPGDRTVTRLSSDINSYALSGDKILDTTSTPSKVLNDSSILMSPPFKGAISVSEETTSIRQSTSAGLGYGTFVEPEIPPRLLSNEWFRIACGGTSAQVEMAEMARSILQNNSVARRSLT